MLFQSNTMAHLVNNPAALEQLLVSCGVGDSALIASSEAALKPFLKHASCLPALVTQLQKSQSIQVRQLAALLIKQRFVLYITI